MHPMIFVALVWLDQNVYVQAHGFTRCVMEFVEAEREHDARQAIEQYFAARQLIVQHVSLSKATQQNRSRYVFPGQIIRATAAP